MTIKLFSENRYICLTNDEEVFDKAMAKYSFSPKEANNLTTLVDDFLASNTINCPHIFYHDVELMMTVILKHFTIINAAGGLVKNENNEVLVINRRGYYDLPKGKKENGETDEQNAIREVCEETGLNNVHITTPLCNSYHFYQINGKFVLKCTHWYNMTTDNSSHLKPQTEEDIIEAKWIQRDKLKNLADQTYASLKDIFLNA